MKVKYILFLLITLIVFVLVGIMSDYTFAYSYELDETVLFYKEDQSLLENDIENYLAGIDDLLVVNSSFEYSDILVDNYDFLVHFALDYVIMNFEAYQDKIIYKDSFSYVSKELEEKVINSYISLEEIYQITDNFFGVRDFEIINEDVYVTDNFVSLTDYTNQKFSLNINKVQILESFDEMKVVVSYNNDVEYLYTFVNDYNVLKIRNIEVLS